MPDVTGEPHLPSPCAAVMPLLTTFLWRCGTHTTNESWALLLDFKNVFALRKPRPMFATKVWLRKINLPLLRWSTPTHSVHMGDGWWILHSRCTSCFSCFWHPAGTRRVPLFHSGPHSPLRVASPNFTKSMPFLQCFGALNLGQEYQQRAAGTNTQLVYLIWYSRMQ